MTELILEDPTAEAADAEANVIYKGYLSSIDEVVEHVRAADTLGLGFRVESYMVTTPEDEGQNNEYEFTLLGDMPVRHETAD